MFTRYAELRQGFVEAIEKLPDYKRANAWEFVKALEARIAAYDEEMDRASR